ncbi:TetR/AcrR family transcriptional regulator [Nocardia higoensis]|uniref:TetR/AcrR family transcriptional regulator n=1 Tax=Nocardia higoensis TaxID=228599 RepID=UPI0002E26B02|nr:TetR/AcrR family transcriptional regulator [Nocardia higoensis]
MASEAAGSRDERITAAALALLRDGGGRAVTIEAVASRSGVAKTTIYRRYRDRIDLLTSALESLTNPKPPADLHDGPAVLDWLVEQALSAVTEGIGTGGVAALLTGEDPDYTRAIRAVLLRHRAALIEVVGAAAESGALRDDRDAETVIDTIVGSYIIEHSRRGSVAEDWSDRIRAVLRPALLPATTE